MKKFNLSLFLLSLLLSLLVPQKSGAQSSDLLLKEYLFPVQYAEEATSIDVIGLRIYSNPENKSAVEWYRDNVVNSSKPLDGLLVDGYRAIRDGRSIYIHAANVSFPKKCFSTLPGNAPSCRTDADCAGKICLMPFYTNIYVLAYNQNASEETKEIFDQMLANLKFNDNLMNIFCLAAQTQSAKDRIRRDTVRKGDFYYINKVFKNSSGALDLQSGTYVPNMSLSTWPSWKDALSKQLKTELPKDPLNIMARTAIKCAEKDDCGSQGQCVGGYCSQCPVGYDPKTCWNERTKDFYDVDGYVYRLKNGTLSMRFEYPEIILPENAGEAGKDSCQLGCLKDTVYYEQGKCISGPYATCQTEACYCDSGEWKANICGDGVARCGEACEGDRCIDCKTCETHYHSFGGRCEPDVIHVPLDQLIQSLSTAEDQVWQGDAWSDPYAISCVEKAHIDSRGICVCNTDYHQENRICKSDKIIFDCSSIPPPILGKKYNTVAGYERKWNGTEIFPMEDPETEYNPEPSVIDCRYTCEEFFIWNAANQSCDPPSDIERSCPRPQNPDGTLIEGVVWNGSATYIQSWNLDTKIYEPAEIPTIYSETEGICHFKCMDINLAFGGTVEYITAAGKSSCNANCPVPTVISSTDPPNCLCKPPYVAMGTTPNEICFYLEYTLTGKVTNALNSEPISGVAVSIIGTTTLALTDSQGNYSIKTLPGSYNIKAEIAGMVPQTASVTLDGDKTQDFFLFPYGYAMIMVLSWQEVIDPISGEIGGMADPDATIFVPISDSSWEWVYYGHKQSDDGKVALDWDTIDYKGIETITIKEFVPGTYFYGVRSIRGDPFISNLTVRAWDGQTGQLLYSGNGKQGEKNDNWRVFSFTAENGFPEMTVMNIYHN